MADISNSEPRKLVYPLTYEETTEEILPIGGFSIVPLDDIFTDNSTRVKVEFELSLDEYVAIASVVDIGRDIAYGNDSRLIWQLWVSIIRGLAMDCNGVADCIDNSVAVQTALANAITNVQSIQSAIQQLFQNSNGSGSSYWNQQVTYLENNAIPLDALCTESNKYAMSLAIVRALDSLTMDMLEVIEILTNPSEIAAETVQGVPIFGGAASLALDTANWLQDNIKEVYEAAYNATTEQDYACAVYCAFTDCALSYDDIIQAYYDGGSISPPTDTDFITVMTWFITNVLPATDNAIVGAMHSFIMLTLSYGSNWFGSGVWTYIDIEIENAKDEEITVPVGCGCSDGWCYTFDWLTSQDGWTACNWNGAITQYSAAIGFYGSGANADRVNAYINFTGDIDYAEITYRPQSPGTPSLVRIYVNTGGCTNSATQYTTTNITNNGDGTFTARWNTLPTISVTTGILVYLESSGTTPVYELQSLTLSNSNGTNPFGLDNC